ncbi:MAG TPA: triose-phosphate isomerase [Gammaproteobacteria bacterium]|nr:triose-phosphate isomerase [Gammaproteobacteria bacterium]
MRDRLVAGNWKMNGTLGSVRALLENLRRELKPMQDVKVAVCPAFVHLRDVAALLADMPVTRRICLGAQNLSPHPPGAHTGEVEGGMLKELGCRYVIIGHSERRQHDGETDELVAAKFARALEVGLTPILCMGETLAEREAGDTERVVARQLDAVLNRSGTTALADAVIAYEPVWAIGTGRVATPAQAEAVHAFLRQRIAGHDATAAARVRILYGGSVKAANAPALFAEADIDGALVGGASLDAAEFAAICHAAKRQR